LQEIELTAAGQTRRFAGTSSFVSEADLTEGRQDFLN
jgi:hypothetical protein